MRHAGPATLARLAPVLAQLRDLAGLKERSHGIFYRGGRAFLHFHEDASGDFADLRRDDGDFERFRVVDAAEQLRLMENVRALLR